MANVKLIFQEKATEKQLQCYANDFNEIYIEILDNDFDVNYNIQSISLDRNTAIRLVRELKKQIGYLESEVTNG
jgi:hypothetical protein